MDCARAYEAALLRARCPMLHERVDSASDDGDDDDDDGCFMPMPKDSVEDRRLRKVTKTLPFECCGTRLEKLDPHWAYRAGLGGPGVFRIESESEEERAEPAQGKHMVQPPAVAVTLEHKIESLLPMSCHVYWQPYWTKCQDCVDRDEAFAKASEAAVRKERYAGLKRRREEEALETKGKMAKLEAAAAAGGGGGSNKAAELRDWIAAAQKLKVDELKQLCAANYMMKKGKKADLVFRLGKGKLHGGAGACPRCLHPSVEFQYPSGDDGTALPTAAVCGHYKGMGNPCGWGVKISDDAPFKFAPFVDRGAAAAAPAAVLSQKALREKINAAVGTWSESRGEWGRRVYTAKDGTTHGGAAGYARFCEDKAKAKEEALRAAAAPSV